MKFLNLFLVFTILSIKLTYALTCEEAKNILNMEWNEDCCDLQQFICDDEKENILSIDILSLQEYQKNNEIENEDETDKKLYARKSRSSSRSRKARKAKKIKNTRKSLGLADNEDCYVSKQTSGECLASCGNLNGDLKTQCENTCNDTLKKSEECRNACKDIDSITGKCKEYRDDYSGASNIKMNTFLWVIVLTLLLKLLY
ncbi:hypothetical protein BCR36DRAFT_351545 [Piromyces finnis]|uniref:Uncharacterized protein n=1 Tax=Piromyces finnis TaxID=1754191 RepID=A0A1Y1VA60_9FUNG|nr:hypothetical protein BCR36DRAFT_351545 [Piromyces finnis]|eukprot:ORX51056.1 hypothetical protein BCR36DRAFT_351545 [Piromyces finnis]